MKLAVVGSRNVKDFDLSSYMANVTMIISGGAKGVDTIAERFAEVNGIPKKIIRPDFSKGYHPRKFLDRNKEIVESADKVLAIWDGKSKGTKFTIDYAKSCGKQVEIVYSM